MSLIVVLGFTVWLVFIGWLMHTFSPWFILLLPMFKITYRNKSND